MRRLLAKLFGFEELIIFLQDKVCEQSNELFRKYAEIRELEKQNNDLKIRLENYEEIEYPSITERCEHCRKELEIEEIENYGYGLLCSSCLMEEIEKDI